jgi:MoxR-like ATPase
MENLNEQFKEADLNNQNKEETNTARQNIDLSEFLQKVDKLKKEASKLLIAQDEIIELIFIGILCEGHILLEGVPGIAKTLTSKVMAKCISADFSRIQFTPDLMPADIIGTSIFNMKSSEFSFKKGPIFSNIVLIDEINRAPAKTQSALFEVMEEKQISFDGETYVMEYPFFIIATQNPIEQEGTYKLPEAQVDRFIMKLNMAYPRMNEEIEILNRFKNSTGGPNLSSIQSIISTTELIKFKNLLIQVFIEDDMLRYIAHIVQETRNHGRIYLGASPRASLAMMNASKVAAMLAGRDFVIPDDIQFVAPYILCHRIIITPEAEMGGVTAEQIIKEIIKEIEVPR